MHNRRVTKIALLASMGGSAILGCNSPSPPAPVARRPPPVTIPIRVWRVLSQFDSGPGNPSNIGCRLDDSAIFSIVLGAKNVCEGGLIGGGLNLNYNYVITDTVDPVLISRQSQTFDQYHLWVPFGVGDYTPQQLNIYFCGNVQIAHSPPDNTAVALTLDPGAAAASPWNSRGFLPCIVVNDDEYAAGTGIPMITPANIDSFNILSHEITHYLARFESSTICGRVWSSDERTPANVDNILRPLVPPALPPYLWGSWTGRTCEVGEICDRLSGGFWNFPL